VPTSSVVDIHLLDIAGDAGSQARKGIGLGSQTSSIVILRHSDEINEGVNTDEVEKIKKQIEEAGGTVELK